MEEALDLYAISMWMQENQEMAKITNDMLAIYLFQPDHPRVSLIENTLRKNYFITEKPADIGGCLHEDQVVDENATIEETAQN